MNRLFVYGIFLSDFNRESYGMYNPRYTTVKDYATFSLFKRGGIVEAAYVPGKGLEMTGLIVDVDPTRWEDIDSLEHGYDRVQIVTTDNEGAYMYARKEWLDEQT